MPSLCFSYSPCSLLPLSPHSCTFSHPLPFSFSPSLSFFFVYPCFFLQVIIFFLVATFFLTSMLFLAPYFAPSCPCLQPHSQPFSCPCTHSLTHTFSLPSTLSLFLAHTFPVCRVLSFSISLLLLTPSLIFCILVSSTLFFSFCFFLSLSLSVSCFAPLSNSLSFALSLVHMHLLMCTCSLSHMIILFFTRSLSYSLILSCTNAPLFVPLYPFSWPCSHAHNVTLFPVTFHPCSQPCSCFLMPLCVLACFLTPPLFPKHPVLLTHCVPHNSYLSFTFLHRLRFSSPLSLSYAFSISFLSLPLSFSLHLFLAFPLSPHILFFLSPPLSLPLYHSSVCLLLNSLSCVQIVFCVLPHSNNLAFPCMLALPSFLCAGSFSCTLTPILSHAHFFSRELHLFLESLLSWGPLILLCLSPPLSRSLSLTGTCSFAQLTMLFLVHVPFLLACSLSRVLTPFLTTPILMTSSLFL